MRHFLKIAPALLLALACGQARADDSIQVYSLDQKSYKFIEDSKNHLLISETCKKKGLLKKEKLSCHAWKAVQALHKKRIAEKIQNRLKGGKNPGSVICVEHFRATLVSGEDAQGNESSFCRFKDGSMVDIGTLTYFAQKH